MGGRGQSMGWGFDIFQKFVVRFPAHGEIDHSSQMHKNFPTRYPLLSLYNYIGRATVEVKPGLTLDKIALKRSEMLKKYDKQDKQTR